MATIKDSFLKLNLLIENIAFASNIDFCKIQDKFSDIQENNFSNKEKALEFYRRLAIDYKGSLYSAEARKRIRLLRGDKNISDDEL